MTNVAWNMCVKVYVCEYRHVFAMFLDVCLRSGIAGSHGNSMFNCLRCDIDFFIFFCVDITN